MSLQKIFLLVIPFILVIFADKTFAMEEDFDKTDVKVYDKEHALEDLLKEIAELILNGGKNPICQCNGHGTCACCLKKTVYIPIYKHNYTFDGCANFTVFPKKKEMVVKMGFNKHLLLNRTIPIKKEAEYCKGIPIPVPVSNSSIPSDLEICLKFYNTTISKKYEFHTCIAIGLCLVHPHKCFHYWNFKCIDIPFLLPEEDEFGAVPVLKKKRDLNQLDMPSISKQFEWGEGAPTKIGNEKKN